MTIINSNQATTVSAEQRLGYLGSRTTAYKPPTLSRIGSPRVTGLLGEVHSLQRKPHQQLNGNPAPETVLTAENGRVVNFGIVDFREVKGVLTRVEETLSVLIYETLLGTFCCKPVVIVEGPALLKCSSLLSPSGRVDVSDRIGGPSLAAHLASTLLRRYPISLPSYEPVVKAISDLTSGNAPWVRFLEELYTLNKIGHFPNHGDVGFIKTWYTFFAKDGIDLCSALGSADAINSQSGAPGTSGYSWILP